MKAILTLSCILAATVAQGQTPRTIFRAGPRAGLNVASGTYTGLDGHSFSPGHLYRGEVGATAQVSRVHWAAQLSVLYSRKGFRLNEEYTPAKAAGQSSVKETYRLNYLALPLNLAYTQHDDGQGFQVFGGGYLAFLLNGQWEYDDQQLSAQPNGNAYGYYREGTAAVLPHRGESVSTLYTSPTNPVGTTYSRRLDAGVQAGLGYRHANVLMQLAYSLGLTNLNPAGAPNAVNANGAAAYRTRTLQLSAAYLLGR